MKTFRKGLLALFAALALVVGVSAATPAYAGRSACPGTYVCAWNNSNWTSTMAAYQPSYVYGAPNHCLDFDQSSSNDAISSIANYNSAAQVFYFRDIHCSGPYLGINPSQQIKDLRDWNLSNGESANDKFTSIYDPNCC